MSSASHRRSRSAPAARKRRVVAEDVLFIRSVEDAQISPDGRFVAFVVSDRFKDGWKNPRSSIWLAELDHHGKLKREPRQFTVGRGSDSLPRWSPAGDKLAFLSDRSDAEGVHLHVIEKDGGEAVQLTNQPGGIRPFPHAPLVQAVSWSPDGTQIAFLAYDRVTRESGGAKRNGDVMEFEKNPSFCGIWTVDIATRRVKRRTAETFQVWEFGWSTDGTKFAAIISDEPYEWSWYRAKLAVISVQTGRVRVVHDPQPRQIARPLWSADGSSIYFISSVWSDRNIVAGSLFVVPADNHGEKAVDLTGDYEGSVSWMERASDRELLVCGVEQTKSFLSRLAVDRQHRHEGMKKVWEDDVAITPPYWQKFSLARSSRMVAVGKEDLMNAPEAWIARISTDDKVEWQRLSQINAHVRNLEFGPTRLVEWDSFDGRKIQGFLVIPQFAVGESRSAGMRIPLIVDVHGGPTLAYGHSYYLLGGHPVQLFASNGFAVLLPNPRGSIGRGLAFAEANVGDMGGGDFRDIMAGVDHCLRMGLFDPNRLYIMGGSYGGYMTAWAVTQTTKFRAAIMRAGISNWVSFHGTSEVPLWDSGHYRSDPYGRASAHWQFSPMAHVKDAKTPTLILVGAEDSSCPPGQSREFFRGLKDNGVETELAVYPREGHGFLERVHIIDAIARQLEWLAKH